MAKVVVIRNPMGGRGAHSRIWPEVLAKLRTNFSDLDINETAYTGHAQALASEASNLGAELVIAIGGDGTISQVANGIFGTNSALGIVPGGTGNDLCRTLEIEQDQLSAVESLISGIATPIDVGRWRSEVTEGIFVNVAGIGFDAAVARRINFGFKRVRGKAAYLAATLTALARFKPSPLQITANGETWQMAPMLLAIANATTYGAGMRIAPRASVVDGLLDLIIVQNLSKLSFIKSFPLVFKGAHLEHPAVDMVKTNRLTLQFSEPTPFLADGELITATDLDIELIPRSLRVILPADSKLCHSDGEAVCDTCSP